MQKPLSRCLLSAITFISIGLILGGNISTPVFGENAGKLKEEMRSPWTREHLFIRDWLICGEFARDHSTDFLRPSGGAEQIRPSAGMKVKRSDGSDAEWVQYRSPENAIDLKKALPGKPSSNVSAYACTSYYSSEGGNAFLALGFKDGFRAWVNGKLVYDLSSSRSAAVPDDKFVQVSLKKGDNQILLEVEQIDQDWKFYCRVIEGAMADATQRTGAPVLWVSTGTGEHAGQLQILSDCRHKTLESTEPNLQLDITAPGGKQIASKLVRRGDYVYFDLSHWADGPYIVTAKTITDPNPVSSFQFWYKGDPKTAVKELLTSAEKADRSTQTGMVHSMLAEAVKDRLAGKIDTADAAQLNTVVPYLSELAEMREQAKTGKLRAGLHTHLAYRDEIDGSEQFCNCMLPSNYTPTKKWPMVIRLHGYNQANPIYYNWWESGIDYAELADQFGVIILYPNGRYNSGYNTMGEQDVLRCIELAKKQFSVDEDRVYLLGYSMGGGGTWTIGTHHPELFAALGIYFGGWDYHVNSSEEVLATLNQRERFLLESNSSFAQAEDLLNLPVWLMHGDNDDLVSVEHTRYAVKMLQRWGYDVRYQEYPGMGHGGMGGEDRLFPWFLQHKRDANPRQVKIRSASLRTAAAYWLKIERSEEPWKFIHADAKVICPNGIRLDTENVSVVTISPGRSIIDPGQPVKITWNDKAYTVRLDETGKATLHALGYRPAKLEKNPKLAGPLSEITSTPFAFVLGTISSDPMMKKLCETQYDTWVHGWEDWQHSSPRHFKDTEISEDDLKRYSLILIGGPDANLITKRLISQIPLEVKPDAFVIGGKSFPVKDAAVNMIYPHPLNPERYIQITAATSPTGMYHFMKLGDQGSGYDFVVVDGHLPNSYEDISSLRVQPVGGFFDSNWQFNSKYVQPGDPDTRSRCPEMRAPSLPSTEISDNTLQLADLLESQTDGSSAFFKRGMNNNCQPMVLDGKTYSNGIATGTWGTPNGISYDISKGNWKRLKSVIGIESLQECSQQAKDNTSLVFIVKGDGKELYRSHEFKWDSKPESIDLDITGVGQLRLEIETTNSSENGVLSVDWADPRLER